jgi:hypothetical protein
MPRTDSGLALSINGARHYASYRYLLDYMRQDGIAWLRASSMRCDYRD